MAAPSFWPPTDVTSSDRKKANVLWTLLLAGYTAFIAYLCARSVQDSRRHTLSLEYRQAPFPLPDVGICFSSGNGCLVGQERACASSAANVSLATVTGSYNSTVRATVDTVDSTCVLLRTSGFSMASQATTTVRAYIGWFPAGNTSTGGAQVTVDPAQVLLKLYDPMLPRQNTTANPAQQTFVTFAGYRPVGVINATIKSVQISLNTMLLGAAHHQPLAGNDEWVYSGVLSQARLNQVGSPDPKVDITSLMPSGTGFVLDLVVPQPVYTVISEVQTVNPFLVIGAIGGAWVYLLAIYWMFVTSGSKGSHDSYMRRPLESLRRGWCACCCGTTRASAEEGSGLPAGWNHWNKKLALNGAVVSVDGKRGPLSAFPHIWADAKPGALDESGTAVTRDSAAVNNRSAEPVSLPAGWEEKVDTRGKAYYFNHRNKMASLRRPSQQEANGGRQKVSAMDLPLHSASMRWEPESYYVSPKAGSTPSMEKAQTSTFSTGRWLPQGVPLPLGVDMSVEVGSSLMGSCGNASKRQSMEEEVKTDPSMVGRRVTDEYIYAHHQTPPAAQLRLPAGWEARQLPNGKTYYLDHINQLTVWEPPEMPE